MGRLAFIVAIVCVFAACHARVAAAQDDFTARGLHAGDHVLVTLESGTPSKGTVTDVSATRLMLDGFLVDPADVRKIERRRQLLGRVQSSAFKVQSLVPVGLPNFEL